MGIFCVKFASISSALTNSLSFRIQLGIEFIEETFMGTGLWLV